MEGQHTQTLARPRGQIRGPFPYLAFLFCNKPVFLIYALCCCAIDQSRGAGQMVDRRDPLFKQSHTFCTSNATRSYR